ncbi:peptidase [Flavobacterium sp.]|uniref:peptidase n=1 Tax=Flavobacterium sp. TaxID=239 RepID=UPI00286DF9C0|nr:peptidase [Flavobacterium sp.]
MSVKRFKRKAFLDKITTKNRLVILNDDTFEEKFSFKLNILNVFLVATIGAIFLISVTSYIIAFTPLREYIPGYSSSELKQNALNLALKSDSLEFALKKNDAYIESVKKVLTGDLEYAKVNKDSIMASEYVDPSEYNFDASEEELELRKKIEAQSKDIKEQKSKTHTSQN